MLHRAAADGTVSQQTYEAIDDPAFAISDHRPVAATFTVAVDLDTAAAAEAARQQPRPRLLALSAALRSALSRSAPHLLLFGRCPATLEVAALAGLSAALLLHPALLSLRATAVRWTPLWWLAASASGLGVGLLAPIGPRRRRLARRRGERRLARLRALQGRRRVGVAPTSVFA